MFCISKVKREENYGCFLAHLKEKSFENEATGVNLFLFVCLLGRRVRNRARVLFPMWQPKIKSSPLKLHQDSWAVFLI